MDGLVKMRGHLVCGEMAPFDFAPLTRRYAQDERRQKTNGDEDAEMMADGDGDERR